MPKGIYDRSKSKPRKGRYDKIDAADTAVCLTCTAKKCTGAAACFKRRKKELEQ